MIKNTALILEGGGFRGMFTAGVLETLLEHELFFETVYGVSAGALYGASYITKQKGRNLKVNQYIDDKRYSSLRNLLRTRSLFGWDFILEELPQKLVPFDYHALKHSTSKFYIGVSNVDTANAEFFCLNNAKKGDFKTILSATCSLPLIAPIVSFNNKRYLDGGLADSIPFEHALANGADRAVVILTRPKGYIKSPLKQKGLFKWVYRKYPKVYEMLVSRAERYNASIERLNQLEREGKAFVIRPDKELVVSRIENKPQKTELAYNDGKNRANCLLPNLSAWLGI
jgi:predicted patatin/cPLA2 family phospholipase